MFGNYWGCICRSRKSAGKVPVKIPDVRSSENFRKIWKSIFWKLSHRAERGHGGELQGAGATYSRGPTLGRRWDPPLAPVAPLWPSFGILLPFDLKNSGVSTNNFSVAEICRGIPLPERGDRYHRHHHHAEHHRDHHQHHLHHQHHHHHHHPISSRCNNCRCVAISSSESYPGR